MIKEIILNKNEKYMNINILVFESIKNNYSKNLVKEN